MASPPEEKAWRTRHPPFHSPTVARAAIRYTLSQTARLNDVDEQAGLGDMLARIAGHSQRQLDQRLPWNRRHLQSAPGE